MEPGTVVALGGVLYCLLQTSENIIIAKSGDFAEQSGVPALAEFPIALVAGVFALHFAIHNTQQRRDAFWRRPTRAKK